MKHTSLDNGQFPYQLFGVGALELGQQHAASENFKRWHRPDAVGGAKCFVGIDVAK